MPVLFLISLFFWLRVNAAFGSPQAKHVIVSGLGGSCSRGVPGILRQAGLYFESPNAAYDTPTAIDLDVLVAYVSLNHSLDYNTTTKDWNVVSKYLDKCESQFVGCGHKDELITFELPFYKNRPNVCAIHVVREPCQFVLSNNFIGVNRWYTALFGKKSMSTKSAASLRNWISWWNKRNHGDTSPPPHMDPELFLLKGRMWNRVYMQLLEMMHRYNHSSSSSSSSLPQLLWRCGQDPPEIVFDFLRNSCNIAIKAEQHAEPPTRTGKKHLDVIEQGIEKWLLHGILNETEEAREKMGIIRPNITKNENGRYFCN